METERWQQISELFQSATERAPEKRASFLDEACDGDESLRREVKSSSTLTNEPRTLSNHQPSKSLRSSWSALAGDLFGQLIGHYRIESLVGIGGMGEVYLARDELLGRKVALKFLPEQVTADERQLSRFKAEARTASALNHPNILTVHEIGADGSRHFIATEFIEGETLRALLAREN